MREKEKRWEGGVENDANYDTMTKEKEMRE